MSVPPNTFGPSSPPPQRSWFRRNALWFVPAIILLPLLVCGGFCAGILTFVSGLIKGSEPYQTALERANSNQAVVARLGEPVEDISFMPMGSINYENSSGTADLSFEVGGPKGTGTMYVVAHKQAGEWSYDRLEVEFADGSRESLIDAP